MSDETNIQLEEVLRKQIADEGGIPFAAFMEQCLYHPKHGYYMADRLRIGKQGDFFTSSSVSQLFGRLVARQLAQMAEVLGGERFTIAEQGPGEGHFALDILDALADEFPGLYARTDYRLVELSPDNRQRQSLTLSSHAARISWVDLDALAGMEGCFLSNELVDAFPVRLLEKHQGALQEVYVVTAPDGRFAEELRAPADAALQHYFSWLGCGPVEGNRAEANLAAADWMRRVAGLLGRGFILTIDYGYPAAELYAPFRRAGTLMCYHRHAASDDPYRHIGCQDLTAHVDFTALQKAGAEHGAQTLYFAEQYRFLMALGFVEALIEMQARTADENQARALRLTLKHLVMPEGGMGETFKVLIQGKDVGQPDLLCDRRLSQIPMAF